MKPIKQLKITLSVINLVTALSLLAGCTKSSDSAVPEAASPPSGEIQTDGGVGNTGGGDSDSRARQALVDLFKEQGSTVKADLIRWLKELRQYRSQGTMSDRIHQMMDSGLVEDIEKSNMVLSKVCTDQSGNIKSMSTERIDNYTGPVRHPDICINVPKLAANKTSYDDLIGNLMHEYGRHFGYEDTEDFGIQPMSNYVSNLLGAHFFTRNPISDPAVGITSQVLAQQPDLFASLFGKISYDLYVSPETKIIFEFNATSGDCSRAQIITWGEFLRADGSPITKEENISGSKKPAKVAGLDVGALLVRPIVVPGSIGGYIGSYIVRFDQAKECRLSMKIKVTNRNQEPSTTELKDLGWEDSWGNPYIRFQMLDLSN